MRAPLLALCFLVVPAAAQANAERIASRDAFVAAVSGKALTRFGITLNVSADGQITGRAFGKAVTGGWTWRDGFFCRTLTFGTENLGDNCQTVEKRGQTLRFTADRGTGDSADLRLR